MMKGMDKMFEEYDVNSDGAVTKDEVDTTRKQKLSKFNADKDGSFSLDEYADLWIERMRSHMVNGFLLLDDDGNGT